MAQPRRSIKADTPAAAGLLSWNGNTSGMWPSTLAEQDTGALAPVEFEMFFYHRTLGAAEYWRSFGILEAFEPGLRIYSTSVGGEVYNLNFAVTRVNGSREFIVVPNVPMRANQWYHLLVKIEQNLPSVYTLQVGLGRTGFSANGAPRDAAEEWPYSNSQVVILPGVTSSTDFRDKALRVAGHPFQSGTHTVRVATNLVGGVAVIRVWNQRRTTAEIRADADNFTFDGNPRLTHLWLLNENATGLAAGAQVAGAFKDNGAKNGRFNNSNGVLVSNVDTHPFGPGVQSYVNSARDRVEARESLLLAKLLNFRPHDRVEVLEETPKMLNSAPESRDRVQVAEQIALQQSVARVPGDLVEAAELAQYLLLSGNVWTASSRDRVQVAEQVALSQTYALPTETDGAEVLESVTRLLRPQGLISDLVEVLEQLTTAQSFATFPVSDLVEVLEEASYTATYTRTVSERGEGGEGAGAAADGVSQLVRQDSVESAESITLVTTHYPEIVIVDEELVILAPLEGDAAMNVVSIWNIATTALGSDTISSTSENSVAANLFNTVWAGFRQQWLTQNPWNGAKTTKRLARFENSDSSSVDPEGTRWTYAYLLPDETSSRPYLSAMVVNGRELQPDNRKFEVEVVENDVGTLKRCLLCDESTVDLEYMFDVTDQNVGLLSPTVAHAMGLALAAYTSAHFGKSGSEQEALRKRAEDAAIEAKGVDGQEGSYRRNQQNPLLDARY